MEELKVHNKLSISQKPDDKHLVPSSAPRSHPNSRVCINNTPICGSFFLYKSTGQEAVGGGAVVVLLHIRGMLSKALLNFDGVCRSPMRQSVRLELSSDIDPRYI